MNRSEVAQLILAALENFVPPNAGQPAPRFDENTVLFGPDGLLDSVALVSFVIDVEEAIRSASGAGLSLADERAMSQSRSPFRRVSSLADYATQLIAESKPDQ